MAANNQPPVLPNAAPLILEGGRRLQTSGELLRPFLTESSVRELAEEWLPRPSRPVLAKGADLQPKDLAKVKACKGKAIIVQGWGQDAPFACTTKCGRGLGKFVGCRVIPGVREGACANCIWQENGKSCCHHAAFNGDPVTDADRAMPAQPQWLTDLEQAEGGEEGGVEGEEDEEMVDAPHEHDASPAPSSTAATGASIDDEAEDLKARLGDFLDRTGEQGSSMILEWLSERLRELPSEAGESANNL